MTIELVPLCEIEIRLKEPIVVGEAVAGTRMIFEVESATTTGGRVNASMRGQASADWMVINGTVGALDVRATMETDDGAIIFTHYSGRVDLSGGPGAAPVYVAPLFETGDERYAWLNAIQAVGKGQLEGDLLHYEWCEVR